MFFGRAYHFDDFASGGEDKGKENRNAAYSYRPNETVKIIFDTDMDTDVDDVGALALLHSYVLESRAELLAVVGSCKSGYAGACIDAINTYYGEPDIPIGISPDCPSSGESCYQRILAETYENDIGSDDEIDSAVDVYRKILSAADDHSVVIVVAGGLNNVQDLLCSSADRFCSLEGVELMRQKVRLVVAMGGMFPESNTEGEYNIRLDPAAAFDVARRCPASICWCGYEVGEAVRIGNRMNELGDSLVWRAYELYFSEASETLRSCWDLLAVMYAVEGNGLYFDERRGIILINGLEKEWDSEKSEAYNTWVPDMKSKDAHLLLRMKPEQIAIILETRLIELERNRYNKGTELQIVSTDV